MVPKISRFCCAKQAGLFLAAILFLSACAPSANLAAAPSETFRPARTGQLTPFLPQPTRAVAANSTAPAHLSTLTPMPSPTATLRSHEVKKGEDMGGIAWKYRVSLEELMAANPTIQPNMMSVGTRLVIPPSRTQAPGEDNPMSSAANLLTPTPVPVEAGRLSCARVEDGGVWCFMAVRNSQEYPLESLSAVFHLAGQQSQTVLSQTAFLPLDRIMPGTWLPLVAYFPPDQIASLTPPLTAGSEMLTSLPGSDDGRYVPLHLENKKVLLAENGRAANLSADIVPDFSGTASRIWVAAVAYDAQGDVVGARRWEKQNPQALESGRALGMNMSVYSVSGEIIRVDLYVEARP